MTDFAIINHVSSVARVSTKRADFISSIEALPYILGGEVNSSLEPLEQRLRWSHLFCESVIRDVEGLISPSGLE